MRKGLMLAALLTAGAAYGWEDDYYISHDDAIEADSYNQRADPLRSDYDYDGTPNYIDPYDNQQTRDPAFRDYDGDGTPNIVDPYDNGWYRR